MNRINNTIVLEAFLEHRDEMIEMLDRVSLLTTVSGPIRVDFVKNQSADLFTFLPQTNHIS